MKRVLSCMVRGHFGLTSGEVWWMNHKQLLIWCGEELAQGSEVRIRVDLVTSADLLDCLVHVLHRLPPTFCHVPKGFLHHGDFSLVDRERMNEFHKDLARANPALGKNPTAQLPLPLQRYIRSATRSEHAAVGYQPSDRTPMPTSGAPGAKDTLRMRALRNLKRKKKEQVEAEARSPRGRSSGHWPADGTPTPVPAPPRRKAASSETVRLKEILRRKAEKTRAKKKKREEMRSLSGENLVVPLVEQGGDSEAEFDAAPDTSTKPRRVKLSAGSLTPIQTHLPGARQEREERKKRDERRRRQEQEEQEERERQAQAAKGEGDELAMGESGLRLDVEELINTWIEDTTKSAIPKPAKEAGADGGEGEDAGE